MKISKEDFGALAICSIRYCQGRETYMPAKVQGIVLERLADISDRDLKVMLRDCDYQESVGLYGDTVIDKPGWLRWRDALRKEKERREKEKK